MFILRSVKSDDLEQLFQLSQFVTFINLPSDKDKIAQLIHRSEKSFRNPSQKLDQNYYVFALEDLQQKKVVGISLIHALHGTEKEPHFYLSVGQEVKYCASMQMGSTHGTLKLGTQTDGYTELGSLVMHPDYRGHPHKLGKQISFVRFLYLGLNPERFRPLVHSELMPPFDENNQSPLWEAIGRRFLKMDYHSADQISRDNKEFILDLYPSENIYQTLLPKTARDAIGKVGPETVAVKKMLESVGFKYTFEVDPFDGGPHYRCALKNILPITQMQNEIPWDLVDQLDVNSSLVLITLEHPEHAFSAVQVQAQMGPEHLQILKDEKTPFIQDFLPPLISAIPLI